MTGPLSTPTGLRAGVVGVGFMGAVHARAIRSAGGVVSRVLGSTSASSQSAAERLGARATSAGLAELVGDPEVDVVHVCAPNHLHHEVASLALEAGKPVVCEKPLATTVADAASLDALARARGQVAVVPFVYRFHPMVREARARVARGELGALTVLHGSYLQDWLSAPEDTNWRVDPALGGDSRTFADIGVHWCDLVEFVTGHRITSLAGKAVTSAHRPTEDAVTLTFQTDGGAIGSLVVSQVSHGRKNALRFTVDGSSASIAFDQEAPDSLWFGRRDATSVVARGADHAAPDARRLSIVPPGHPQGYQDAFNALVLDAYTAIAGRVPEGLPTFADGLRAAHLTDAVLAAVRSETWVAVQRPDREKDT